MFLLVRESLTDDCYITLAYAKNLAMHGEWGLVPGSPANSATSPLNVLLLGALTLVTRIFGDPHPVLALGALNVLASATLGWGWMRLLRAFRLPPVAAVLGIALVLQNTVILVFGGGYKFFNGGYIEPVSIFGFTLTIRCRGAAGV